MTTGLDTATPPTLDTRAARRHALAHDASPYLLVPSAVAAPRSIDEVRSLLAHCRRSGASLTFRSGGTSLSGQASSPAILVDTRGAFRAVEVLDGGQRVRVQPGATVRHVNNVLARHGRKLGPDPASEIACTVGGVVANNSSGMACGTSQNTYQTIDSMVVVLASGTVIDTGSARADDELRAAEPTLYRGLETLRDRVRADAASVERVRRLFAMKNTMGYGVNAFLDFERPVDILTRIMVGSEGTLGFVASATFRTVEAKPHARTGLAVFPDMSAATASLPALVDAGFTTIELLDARSLAVAQELRTVPAEIAGLAVAGHAALLLEHQASSASELDELDAASRALLRSLDLSTPVELTGDPARRASLWATRKGLYTAVAEARPRGTSALLEDIAVPVPQLLHTCDDLVALFAEHGYDGSVIFGHAKDGNIHFMLNERFDEPARLERFRRFTDGMVDLVLAHGGTLKAEHGTGRVMAPYVRRQYGEELYEVMREVKTLFDPHGILNPGAVLTDEPEAFLENLKAPTPVEEEVDRCVECGYCEPSCPSKDLTLTPRQRIALRRDMAAAEARGDHELADELRREYQYLGVETCAVDGMCQVACPVNINTGDLVRRLRHESAGRTVDKVWGTAARHWAGSVTVAGKALSVAAAIPAAPVTAASELGRKVLGADVVPRYDGTLPGGGRRRTPRAASDAEAVFFPACVGSMFGPEDGGIGATRAFEALCERAGVTLVVPEGIGAMCCGTPWKSKGLESGYTIMTERVLPRLWEATRHGALPVVVDASSCTEGLETMRGAGLPGLRILDALEFTAEQLLDQLEVTAPVSSIVLHPTCSTERSSTTAHLERIARAISSEVATPLAWGCCAFAGDRGMLHPELTASATAAEAAEVAQAEYEVYASANRTCEIGMTRATGRPYVHILEALETATRTVG